jgi:hypothetical protein
LEALEAEEHDPNEEEESEPEQTMEEEADQSQETETNEEQPLEGDPDELTSDEQTQVEDIEDSVETEYQKVESAARAQSAREEAYVSPRNAEWKKYGPQIPRGQVPEQLRDFWDDAHTICRPLWIRRQDQEQDAQELEQQRIAMLDNQNQMFQRILESKDPTERAALWRRLINQANYTADGLSKEISRMYLCWFRTACLNRDATLELDDITGQIDWNGIRVEVNQLTECHVQRIIREPIEQRLNMIQKCFKQILFSEEQQQRLQASIFSSGQLEATRYVKMFRKALELGIFGWTRLINILHDAMKRGGLKQVKRLTTEYFDQAEFRALWYRMSQFTDVESQLRGRLEMRELGIVLPKGSEQKYFKWMKSLTDPLMHAKAMILLKRTQELSKDDWDTLRATACERFGSETYLALLRRQDEILPRHKSQEAPTLWPR